MRRMVLGLLCWSITGALSPATLPARGEPAPVAPGPAVDADPPWMADESAAGQAVEQAREPGYYRLVHTYQSKVTAPLGVIENPTGLHVARDGTVFVADGELHRVTRFTPEGEPLGEYGRAGREPGQLLRPSGVATDLARDRVYVGDTGNDRVAVFRLDGSFVENWPGVVGAGALAVAPDGQVYARQGTASNNVSLRRLDGSEVLNFNVLAPPDLRDPGVAGGLAVAASGEVYVAIGLGVQILEPDGNFKKRLRYPGGAVTRDVSFDGAGRVYVLESGRLWRQTSSREFDGVPMGLAARAIAAGAPGMLYFIVPATSARPATVVLRRFEAGRATAPRLWGIPQTVLGWLNQPFRLSTGADGEVYTVDNLRRAQRFGPRLDAARGQLLLPGLQEVTAAAGGDLIVVRKRYASSDLDPDDPDTPPPGMQRISVERYALGSGLSTSTPADPPAPAWRLAREEPFAAPDASHVAGMAYDAARDRTIVLDPVKRQVWGIDGAGKLVLRIDLPAIDAGLPAWRDVAVGPDGAILALHGAARRVFRFTAEGVADGAFLTPEWPWRLDVDAEGGAVIATAQRWLWVLDPAGRPKALWPLPAPIEGNMDPPADVAAERGGAGLGGTGTGLARTDAGTAPGRGQPLTGADSESGVAGRVYVLDQAAAAIYAFARIGEGDPGEAPGSHLIPLPQPPPGAPRPPAGSLVCEIRSSVAVEPLGVLIGTPALVTLTLDGACAPHRRTGEMPGLLAHSAVVSLTLPAGVELVPGSLEPPGTVDGRSLSWRLDAVPSGGLRLRYAVSAASVNRWRVLERGSLAWLDGWFNYGAAELPTTQFYTFLSPTPTNTPRPTATPTIPAAATARPGADGRKICLPLVTGL